MKKTISCFTISILSLFLGSFAVIQSDWFQEYSPDVLSRGKILHQIPPSSTSSEYTLSSIYPYLVLWNTTAEDIEGGRESDIIWYGEDSDGTRSTLARIRASHDGTSKDQKADLRFYTNDGSDNDAPTERMRLDADGDLGLGTTDPSVPFEMAHTSPGILTHNLTETDADEARSSFWQAQGEQSGGELSTLGKIQISHDGTSDDQKGQIGFYTNDGDDDDSPTLAVTIDSNGNIILPQKNTPTMPTLAFGDGDTGFYSNADGSIRTTLNGTLHFRFDTNYFAGVQPGSAVLYDVGGTATSPTITFSGDVNNGIYRPDSDQLAITTNGIQRLMVNSTGETEFSYGIVPAHKGSDPCGSGFPEGTIFWNMSSHYLCACDGSNDIQVSDGTTACF